MYKKYKPKGLNLVGINSGDSPKVIQNYYKQGKFTFPTVMDAMSKNSAAEKYGVQAYPTTYVIKPNGTVAARFVGADLAALNASLSKLGIK